MENKTDKAEKFAVRNEALNDPNRFARYPFTDKAVNPAKPLAKQEMGEGNAPRVGQLKRDGKVVFEGSEGEAMSFVHRNHSFSYDHALKHEGFSYDTAEEISIRAARKA